MSRHPQTVLAADGITLVATHQVLADVARDLVRAWGQGPAPMRPVVLHVGAHRSRRLPGHPEALQIGVQTEQMWDQAGRPLWKRLNDQRLARMVQDFDLLLDLSEANVPAYSAFCPAERAKIRFGAHIFPQLPPPPRRSGDGLLFVGALNARRRAVLDRLGAQAALAPAGTFGPELDFALDRAAGLLNLHFEDGVYSEYPRILKAVLAGRALWSEPLAAPLVEDQHYFSLDARPEAARVIEVQQAMAQLLCSRFSLRAFVCNAVA